MILQILKSEPLIISKLFGDEIAGKKYSSVTSVYNILLNITIKSCLKAVRFRDTDAYNVENVHTVRLRFFKTTVSSSHHNKYTSRRTSNAGHKPAL